MSRRARRASAALAIGLLAVAGPACGDGGSDDDGSSGGLATIVDGDGAGGEVAVDAGQRVGVRLPSSASIGDDWVLLSSSAPAVAAVVDERHVVDDPEADGSGGTVTFVVEGRAPGTTQLVFVNCFQGACDEQRLPDDEQIAADDLDTATVEVVVRGEG